VPAHGAACGGHWTLIVADIPATTSDSMDVRLRWYNSKIAIGNPQQAAELVMVWIHREHPRGNAFNFLQIEVMDVPQQVGDVDCGIHIISFILHLARGEEIPQETGMDFANVRRDEYANLLAQTARASEPVQMELEGWTVDETQANLTS
jgi:Ulp1 family protease